MKTDLFACTHKVYVMPELGDDVKYIPIDCGETDMNNYIHANIRDNIAEKGTPLSELRHIYWIWKNYELSDYVGICHYRRYFQFNLNFTEEEMKKMEEDKKEVEAAGEKWYEDGRSRYATYQDEIEANVNSNSIIVPYPIHNTKLGECETIHKFHEGYNEDGTPIFREEKEVYSETLNVSNKEVYEHFHNKEDIEKFIEVINNDFPYLKTATEKALSSNLFYCNYMFIMTKELFNEFCTIMFAVLEKYLDKYDCKTPEDYYNFVKNNIDKYQTINSPLYDENFIAYLNSPEYQCRFPAFVFERFLNIFIEYKNLNLHYVGRYFFQDM